MPVSLRIVRFCKILLSFVVVFFSAGAANGVTINEFPNVIGDGGITLGPDGNLWFTIYDGAIGQVTTSGSMTTFKTPMSHIGVKAITKGPDGNLWFTESLGNKIGRITPDGHIIEFSLPSGTSLPGGITSGPDGNIWFTESYPAKIVRITPTGVMTEFTVSFASGFPGSITSGPDGNIWFITGPGGAIGRITPTGDITQFVLPIIPSQPGIYIHKQIGSVTAGPDGNIWFTEEIIISAPIGLGEGSIVEHTSWIGQITPFGKITEFAVPTDHSQPTGITIGPDGNIWFTEAAAQQLGQVLLDLSGPQPTAVPALTEWGTIFFILLVGLTALHSLRQRKLSSNSYRRVQP